MGQVGLWIAWMPLTLLLLTAEPAAQEMLRNNTPRPGRGFNHDLPVQPPKPSLPTPRFHGETIVPPAIRTQTISKENLPREEIRPRHLENRAILLDRIPRENIRPRPIPPSPILPPRLPHDPLPTKQSDELKFRISLPPLAPPTILRQEHPHFEHPMPEPDHRRVLGW